MENLDGKFWTSIGAENLSAPRKKEFENVVMDELQFRIGDQLCKGLTNDQLKEFNSLHEGDFYYNSNWLKRNHPDYKDSKFYSGLKKRGYEGEELIDELACVLWLHENSPDYPDIVNDCKRIILKEIKSYFSSLKHSRPFSYE